MFFSIGNRASMAQSDCASTWWSASRRFDLRRVGQHSVVEIGHGIFATVIRSLPLIQDGRLSDSGKRKVLVKRLEDKVSQPTKQPQRKSPIYHYSGPGQALRQGGTSHWPYIWVNKLCHHLPVTKTTDSFSRFFWWTPYFIHDEICTSVIFHFVTFDLRSNSTASWILMKLFMLDPLSNSCTRNA